MDPVGPPNKTHRTVPLKLVLLVVALVAMAGFVHIVHGGSVGIAICAKDGWGLDDTFVNLDDYIGKPLISSLDKAKVLRAMFACGKLQRPDSLESEGRVSRPSQMFSESRLDTTKIKIRKYAFEAYPAWQAAHPDKACPEKLSDLNEYMNSDDSNDSWGKPIVLLCGSSLPPGAKGIGVVSAGADNQAGTEDDIKSWE